MKVAIVCDWLLGTGGAERVVLELHKMFSQAPIYTSQYNPNPKIWYGNEWFAKADIRTTWLQKLPRGLKKFLPVLRAWSFSRLNLSHYDFVISASGAEAKFVKAGSTTHICYCHAPTHYYWARYEQYLAHPGFGWLDPLARLGLKLLVGPMRHWDYKAAQRPNYLIANSTYTQSQIKKYYGRESEVIHPPVDIECFASFPSTTRHGFVTAGRQTPYKRIDLAVAVCSKLNLPLTVIGNGPDHKKLRKMAGPTITFLTNVPDAEMPKYFAGAEAFIFPGIDDFGIVAVEAMAAGTPVIAYKAGGALDYVKPGKTGHFFEKQTVNSIAKALDNFRSSDFKSEIIKKAAANFSPAAFSNKLADYIARLQ